MNISKNRIKQILTFLILLCIGLSVNSISKAYEVFEGETHVADNGHFTPHMVDGDWTFCISMGKAYSATWSRALESKYPEGTYSPTYCSLCNGHVSPEWTEWEKYYTMEYKYSGAISTEDNQDVAYMLYQSQPDFSQDTQFAIWSTSLNNGQHSGLGDNELANEGSAYKSFYEKCREDGKTFEDSFADGTNYEDLKIGIDYSTKTNTVGPIRLSWVDGTYGEPGKETNKFAWVKKFQIAVTYEDGSGAIITPGILDEYGKVLSDYGRDGKDSLNNKDLYLTFRGEVKEFLIRVELEWVDSYEAELSKYKGVKVFRKWQYEYVGTHAHSEEDKDGNIHTKYGVRYRYKLIKDKGEEVQDTLHMSGSAREKVGFYRYSADSGHKAELDKMEIAGYVFLDKDEGKVNEGNNIREDDEGLPGADVWVYSVDQNGKNELVYLGLTDQRGYYSTGKTLNPMRKYYVQFYYNGMLYDSVNYRMDVLYNSEEWKKTSKAKEVNREDFNKKFAEIGSYPSNYKIVNKMFGDELGDYNKVYLQENIVAIYKEISRQIVETRGDIKKACEIVANKYILDTEIKNKIQFAVDCRMMASTDRDKINVPGADYGYVYPVYTNTPFTIYETTSSIRFAGITFRPIYEGQRFINYGMKARPTVDLALYKDVVKADVSINGKTESYNYDLLSAIDPDTGKASPFTVGVRESDYLEGLRGAYKDSKAYKNETQTRDVESDTYTEYTRYEEMQNVELFDSTGGTPYNLEEKDRLNIEILYKVQVINQSSTKSAVKEIVDYYSNELDFVSAFVGEEKVDSSNGQKIVTKVGEVAYSEHSKYPNSEYKSAGYKTIYLTPDEKALDNNQTQSIYIKLRLTDTPGKANRAGEVLRAVLKSDTDQLELLNVAEINGYTTYNEGLIDIDSNPGNLNISGISKLTTDNLMSYPDIRKMYEDDTRRAPAMLFKTHQARTLSGTVFEDNTGWNNDKIHTKETRKANGVYDKGETGIAGVQVDLIEIKNNQQITRASKLTDSNGNYTFTALAPGDYILKYTYGHNDETAMNTDSVFFKGLNKKSYNGQDFQATVFNNKTEYYWYTANERLSDAYEDEGRKNAVIQYSNKDYDVEITNHKAEVFKAYENPQPAHIDRAYNERLKNELKEKTYRTAYTPEIVIEVEYAKKSVGGNQAQGNYAHDIVGVDFGVVERPREELVIDQEVARVKVTGADGATVLFDSDGTNKVANLNWTKGNHNTSRYHGSSIGNYKIGELANVILDEELMNGAKIEITYKFTVTNNSEQDGNSTTAAKTILNYVGNNLDYDESKNTGWKVVKVEDVQNDKQSTFVNNTFKPDSNELKVVDLSTQSTILQTTPDNSLTKALAPGEQTTATLTLSKVLSTESAVDMLSYSNIAEIVEVSNTVGRFDRGATPGNQDPNVLPTEHDTTGVEGNGVSDATVIVTPPTGSKYIYYVLGIGALIILAGGTFLIKKFVINKKK